MDFFRIAELINEYSSRQWLLLLKSVQILHRGNRFGYRDDGICS
jgi:hypothetical protein